tara:strand:- start:464 stop:634 length:171 start_codon:yes stop_codon:yes gene_type:complete
MGSASSIQQNTSNSQKNNTEENNTEENNNKSESIFFFINNQYDIGETFFNNFILPV